jgi:hypothetical protein
MNESDQFSAEELEACRQRAEAALQTAAERTSQASQEGAVVVYFDWEIPELSAPHLFTFLARVRSQAGERSLRIPIDIAKLDADGRTADLERLCDILATRHAQLDDRHSLVHAVEWLLTISLEQIEPELSPAERQVKMCRLLKQTLKEAKF